jgi:hypothetical protein
LKSILLWPRTELLDPGEVASNGYDRATDKITLDEVAKIVI